jgi:hypothetical protein
MVAPIKTQQKRIRQKYTLYAVVAHSILEQRSMISGWISVLSM